MINKALSVALKAHDSQLDKGGHPYIFHPVRVALHCDTESEKVVALMHDVLEDSDMTVSDLRSEGFSEDVLAALDALTRRDGEDYMDFIRRLSSNPLAVRVKLADLEDNMDISRLGGKEHPKLSLYKEAWRFLEQVRIQGT